MMYSFLERFNLWICRTFGHSEKSKCEPWVHNDQIHHVCKRCGRIVSKNKVRNSNG